MKEIEQAIKKGYLKTTHEKFLVQTWEMLEKESIAKKIYIWGVGAATEQIFYRIPDLKIFGAVDKDSNKWGASLETYIFCGNNEDIIINSPNSIEKDSVVIISSLRYLDEIADELDSMNNNAYYSLLHMESNDKEKLDSYENELVNETITNYQICKNKVLVWSMGTYSNHEKYITEELVKRYPDIDIVWIMSDLKCDMPKSVRRIFSGNIRKVIYEIETAKVWLTGTMMPAYAVKRLEQKYIYLKHWASITLKKFYLDAPSVVEIPGNRAWWLKNSEMVDYIVVGSKFDANSCKRGISENALPLFFGSPRSDVLFGHNIKKELIRKRLGIPEQTKIVLYAPTYRFEKSKEAEVRKIGDIYPDFSNLINVLERQYCCKWIILFRLHPALASLSKNEATKYDCIDVGKWPDVQELIAVSDIVITDYSSLMFEPSFVGKSVILYAPDKNQYIDNEYELLINYDTLPFPIATNDCELQRVIEEFSMPKYEEDVRKFLSKYSIKEDGLASQRTAEFVNKLCED